MTVRDQIEGNAWGLALIIMGQTADLPVLDLLAFLAGLAMLHIANREPKPRKDTTE